MLNGVRKETSVPGIMLDSMAFSKSYPFDSPESRWHFNADPFGRSNVTSDANAINEKFQEVDAQQRLVSDVRPGTIITAAVSNSTGRMPACEKGGLKDQIISLLGQEQP